MGMEYFGTTTLSSKLTKILYTHIKHNLPDILKEIHYKSGEVERRLKVLGPPLPDELAGKLQMAWTMVMDFCTAFKDAIAGKAVTRRDRIEVPLSSPCSEANKPKEAPKSK
jgi:hypothetical protein